jgi:hypothetical protein
MIWAVAVACLTGTACSGGSTPSGSVAQARPPAPTFARTVVLAPVGGKVLIEMPGAARGFVRLATARTVPVGTVVDTTAGTVSLTSANPTSTAPPARQTGRFFLGMFRIEQGRTGGGLVDLVIRDETQGACATSGARGAAVNRRVLGLLRGSARGRFRTTGRFAAATVRGTDWGVRDRCDGTLTVVRTGVVAVLDFRLHKTVLVRAGQTYLAEAP